MRILYIDDNKGARLVFEEAFFYKDLVTTVSNTSEALTELKLNKYDLIICDVVMPNQDGLSFAKQLSASEIDTPFILASAAIGLHNLDDYHGLRNYRGFILKPITPERVEELLKNELCTL